MSNAQNGVNGSGQYVLTSNMNVERVHSTRSDMLNSGAYQLKNADSNEAFLAHKPIYVTVFESSARTDIAANCCFGDRKRFY